MLPRITLACLTALLVACPASRGALSIDLKTDLAPGFEIESIEITLDGRTVRTPIGFEDTPATGTRVARFDDLPNGRVAFDARLLGPGGRLIATERRGPIRVEGETVSTLLYTRRCAAIVCPPAGMPSRTSCLNSICVEPECGPDDLDSCGPADCVTSADCTPSPVDCAQTECIDGGCLDIPIEDACEPGTRCTLEGCQELPGIELDAGTDTGPADTGPADTGPADTGPADTGPADTGPADTGPGCTPDLPCSVLADECETGFTVCTDGVSGCEARPTAAGTVCRPATGTCDVQEVCDGINPSCPANAVLEAGTSCRPAEGVCDRPEICDGTRAECPTDIGLPGFPCASEECSDPEPCICRPVSGVPTPYEFLDCTGFRCDDDRMCTPRGVRRGRECTQPDPPDC